RARETRRACAGSRSRRWPGSAPVPSHADHVVELGEPGDETLVDARQLELDDAAVDLVAQLEVADVVQLREQRADRLPLPQLDHEPVLLRPDPLDQTVGE